LIYTEMSMVFSFLNEITNYRHLKILMLLLFLSKKFTIVKGVGNSYFRRGISKPKQFSLRSNGKEMGNDSSLRRLESDQFDVRSIFSANEKYDTKIDTELAHLRKSPRNLSTGNLGDDTISSTFSSPCLSVSLDCEYDNQHCYKLDTPSNNITCNNGKPHQLLWIYRGTLCDDSNNNQPGFICEDLSDQDLNTEDVFISIRGNETDSIYFSETVLHDQGILLENITFDDNIIIEVHRGDSVGSEILQRMVINIACDGAEDLTIGKNFGALQLGSFMNADGLITEGFKKLTFKNIIQNVALSENEILSAWFNFDGKSKNFIGSINKALDVGGLAEKHIDYYISVLEPGFYRAQLSVTSDNNKERLCNRQDFAFIKVENTSTKEPTYVPSQIPTNLPTTEASEEPTQVITNSPTVEVSTEPTQVTTHSPTIEASTEPSQIPTNLPTTEASEEPTQVITNSPTVEVSTEPSQIRTNLPMVEVPTEPTQVPTNSPIIEALTEPTQVTKNSLTVEVLTESIQAQTNSPMVEVSTEPTQVPTDSRSTRPSYSPAMEPISNPTISHMPFAPMITPAFSCKRPLDCTSISCQIKCPMYMPRGYYPDLTDCASYCFCTGTEDTSRYETCQHKLYFDPLKWNLARGDIQAHPLSQWMPDRFGQGYLWGSEEGVCNWPSFVNDHRPPGCIIGVFD